MLENSALTLREGMRQFCEENAAVFSNRDVSPEAQEFFRCHDTAHVVFGCDTSIFGEGVVKIFTIFGTTLSFWKHLSAYAEANAFDLFRQYSWRYVFRHVFKLIASMPRVIIHARRMSRPWPWADHDQYLDKRIDEIRKEFKIEVVRRL